MTNDGPEDMPADALVRLLDETIDVDERLRTVKAAGGRPPRRPSTRPVLLASAGAATALVVYLRWRSAHRDAAVARTPAPAPTSRG